MIEAGDKSRRISEMITADYIVRNNEVVQRRDACACNEGEVYAVEKGSIAPVSAKRLEVRVGKYHRSSARAVERSDRAVQDSREDRIAPIGLQAIHLPYQKRTKYRPIYRLIPLRTLSNLFRVNSRWVDGDRVKTALYGGGLDSAFI